VIRPQKKAAPLSFRARLSLALAVLLGRMDGLIAMNREQRRAVERSQRRAGP